MDNNNEFYVEVVEIRELEDGSAELVVEMNDAAKEFFVKEGLLSVLMKSVNETLEESSDEKKCCSGTCCSDVSNNG